jgi:hypothetical protein
MVSAAQKQSDPNDSGTWGGPRRRAWEQNGKRAVVPLDASVFGFIDLVCKSTKRTKRSLVLQVFLEGLRSLFGVTVESLAANEYSAPVGTLRKPVESCDALREWAEKNLTEKPTP